MKRILHLADLHLGKKSSSDPASAANRLQALRSSLRHVRELPIDAIVVAGDVFDSPYVDPSVVLAAARLLESARDNRGLHVPVVLISGNHDPADATELWRTFCDALSADSTVTVALRPTLVPLASGSLLIEAYPCGSRYSIEPPWAERLELTPQQSNSIRVVVAHGTLQGGPIPGGDSDGFPFTRESADALGADYVALGHFHSIYPRWPYAAEECERPLSYSGTPEPDQFGLDAGWGLIVELQRGVPTKARRVATGVTCRVSVRVESAPDIDKLEQLRDQVESDEDPRRYFICLDIARRTTLPAEQAERLRQLEVALEALGATLTRHGEIMSFVDVEHLDFTSTPNGAVQQTLVSLREELNAANDSRTRDILRTALQMGWEQLREDR